MVRVCPNRDAVCPNGMSCPYAVDRYTCNEQTETSGMSCPYAVDRYTCTEEPMGVSQELTETSTPSEGETQ